MSTQINLDNNIPISGVASSAKPDERYLVVLNGEAQIWDANRYNKNAQQLYADHPEDALTFKLDDGGGDLKAALKNRLSSLEDRSWLNPNAIANAKTYEEILGLGGLDDEQFFVTLDNETQVWDAGRVKRNADRLMKDHPDAKISMMTYKDYWYDKALADEEKLNAMKPQLDELSKKVSEPRFVDPTKPDELKLQYNTMKSEYDALQSAYDSNPRVVAYKEEMAAAQAEAEKRLPSDLRNQIADGMAEIVEEGEWIKSQVDYEGYSVASDKPLPRHLRKSSVRNPDQSAEERLEEINKERIEEREAYEKRKELYSLEIPNEKGLPLKKIREKRDATRVEFRPNPRPDDVKNYNAATAFLDAYDYLKGNHSSVAQGMWYNISESASENALNNAYNVLKKLESKCGNLNEVTPEDIQDNLSESEQVLLKSYFLLKEEEAKTSDAFKGGIAAGESAKIGAEFLVFNIALNAIAPGAGTAAGAANAAKAAKVASAAAKWYSGGSKMAKLAKGALKVSGALAKGGLKATAFTALAPTTYKHISEKKLTIDENGRLMDSDEDIMQYFAEDVIENFTEFSGDAILGLFGKTGKWAAGTKIGGSIAKRMDGSWLHKTGKWLATNNGTKWLKRTGFHGLPAEIFEEFEGAVINQVTGLNDNAIAEFADKDNLTTMLIGFAPMTLLGMGTGLGTYAYASHSVNKNAKKLRNILLENGYKDEQINHLLNYERQMSPESLAKELNYVLATMKHNGTSKEAMEAVTDYAVAVGRYKAMEGAFEAQQSELKSKKLDELTGKLGTFYQTKNEGTERQENTVTQATLYDGRTVFLTSEKNEMGEFAAVDAETGDTMPVAESDIALLENAETGESSLAVESQSLDTYLTSLIMGERQAAEKERMDNDRATQVAALQNRLKADAKLDIGTSDAPVYLAYLPNASNDGMAHFTMQDGSETILTWEQVGDYLNQPIRVLTDAQLAEAEAAELALNEAQMRTESAETNEDMDKADESVEVAVESEEKANPVHIPMNPDGTVNTDLFWDQNPEEWVKWNDEQKQDGGVDSMAQIAAGLQTAEAKLAEASKMPFGTPTQREARDQEMGFWQDKINRYNAILEQYQISEEIEESEDYAVADAQQELAQQPSAAQQILRDLYSDESLSEEEIESYINANVEGSQKDLDKHLAKAPKMGRDMAKYKQEKAAFDAKTADLEAERDLWREVAAYVSAPQIEMDMEPQNALELAAAELSVKDGGIKILPESFRRHTGYGKSEQVGFLSILRTKQKGGISMEAAGERLMEIDRENATDFFDQSDPNAGLNTLLELLSSVKSSSEIRNYILGAREELAQQQTEAVKGAIIEHITQEQEDAQPILEESEVVGDMPMTPQEASAVLDAMLLSGAKRTDGAVVAAMQDFADAIAVGVPAKVVTRKNVIQTLKDAGVSERKIAEVKDALRRIQYIVNGFEANGVAYMLAEGVITSEHLRGTYVHERQHIMTAVSGIDAALMTMTSREELQEAIAKLTNSNFYDGKGHMVLADELISMAMERAYKGENLDEVFERIGFKNENAINFIKDIDNAQRNDSGLSLARVAEIGGNAAEGGSRQDGRTALSGSTEVGEQGPRSVGRGEETTGDNTSGRGVGFSVTQSIKRINNQFNAELQQQIDGTLLVGHVYQLGMPSRILRSTGIADVPIQLNSTRLEDKAKNFGHDFDLSEIKDLVNALQSPMGIFAYGDKSKAQNIVVEIQHRGKNFIVGLAIKPTVNGRVLDVNSIRNVFPKDNAEWLNWISQNKALYLDKEKIQGLIDQQRTNLADVEYLDLDSIAKIVENFENPSSEDIQFSVITPQMDADYLAAVERGDMEAAQRMVNEAAKLAMPNTKVVDENGNLKVVYHVTRHDFVEFNTNLAKSGRYDTLTPKGIFTSENPEMLTMLGEKVMPLFANATNGITFKDRQELEEYLQGNGFEDSEERKDLITRFFKYMGYDMVELKDDYSDTQDIHLPNTRIFLYPNQVKSAEPVTYDDNGNVIPLSERFNPEKSDIRFSARTDEQVISDFAKKHSISEGLVSDYADAMSRNSSGAAAYALKEIKREIRINNSNLTFSEFSHLYAPIKQELFAQFGNYDALHEEMMQRTIEARNLMEAAEQRAREEAENEMRRLKEFEDMDDVAMDEAYFAAMEAGDNASMRDIINEAARRNGYSATDFRMAHKAPSYDEQGYDGSMVDVANNLNGFRESIEEQFRMNRDSARQESVNAIRKAFEAIEKGETPVVRVYRAVPREIREGSLRNGDWVTLSRAYAVAHGENALEGDYDIQESSVPASDLYWDGNDINEWGYDDKSDYLYKNTANNRKLNILVTRDSSGNIIPPSQRFNEDNTDVRFSTVMHGTAAEFDKFDHQHMGEGEGVQAYGWGTYLTEVEEIARTYAVTMRNKLVSDRHRENRIINSLARDLLAHNTKQEALDYLYRILGERWSDKKRVRKQIKIIESGKFLPEGKYNAFLYTVEIPDDAPYIIYENAIEDQQEVYDAIVKGLENEGWEKVTMSHHTYVKQGNRIVINIKARGADLYAELSAAMGSDKEASEFLARNGVVGISYPAQFRSGGRADEARNYVIFNEDDAQIKGSTRFSIANHNQTVFVSNAAKAVEGIKQEKATPTQWLAMLEKNGGLKAAEDKWMGLSDWLKESDKKTLTKAEVLEFINENMIVIEEEHYDDSAEDKAAAAHRGIVEVLQNKYNDYITEYHEENGYEDEYGDPASQYAIEKLREEMQDTFPYTIELVYGNEVYVTFDYEDEDEMIKWAEKTGVDYIPGQKSINSTRRNYTTEGLDNLHEIALTVPTILPWETSDYTHFGDAGNGRAVAWIRFGDTQIVEEDSYMEYEPKNDVEREIKDYIEYAMRNGDDFNTSVGYAYNQITDAPSEAVGWTEEAVTAVANGMRGKEKARKILVIDEIQSNRHQEGRKRGYKDIREIRAIQKRKAEIEAEIKSLAGAVLDGDRKAKRQQDALFREHRELSLQRVRGEIPDAPFEKNWPELAMKRMLRYAAENGYDYIAWTKGAQQAERYDIGAAVESIYYAGSFKEGIKDIDINLDTRRGASIHLQVDNEGKVINEYNDYGDVENSPYTGKNLSEILGKELSSKVLSLEEEQSLSGDGLRVGGEGMHGFYDKMLPAFMNKYGKKWGIKVEDINLPNLEDGLTMHSVPVTEEMKASVMEGQTMFSVQLDPAVRAEMDVIKATAMVNGNYMKAPNGQPTKLTEDQWALVRTKNFKNWFGDWENDPENASKVVDENGEPMEVYHGSGMAFTVFDKRKSDKNNELGTGFYFTDNPDIADLYTRSGFSDNEERYVKRAREIFNEKGAERGLAEEYESIEHFDFMEDHLEGYGFLDESVEADYEEAFEQAYEEMFSQKSVMPVFLNIRKPYMVEDVSPYNARELAKQKDVDGFVDRDFSKRHAFLRKHTDNKDFSQYVALNPNQIKSATETTGEFSESEDIRFSVGEAVVANTKEDSLPLTRKDAIARLKELRQKAIETNEDGLPYFVNEETGIKVFVSNADARHTMMYHNTDQFKVIGVYDRLIANAKFEKYDEVDPEEAETTEEVRKYVCPVILDGKQYIARMTIKKYKVGNYMLGEMHLYDTKLKDDNSAPDASSQKRIPILNSQLSSFKDKDTNNFETANETEQNVPFSVRTKPAPEKTGIGYKVFYLKDGKLYPPMVANLGGVDTPVGVWLDAEEGTRAGVSKTGRPKVKQGGKGTQGGSGTLAYRPGWHLGEIPYAIQFNRKDENGDRTLFPADFVWAEVEYADDVNYQEEAMSYGMNANGKFQHSLAGLPKLPTDGSYRYRTNPNPETDPWIITGAMKVNRLLSPSEVDNMVREAGREPQKRQDGAVTEEQINELNESLGLSVSADNTRFSATERSVDEIVNDGVQKVSEEGKKAKASLKQRMDDIDSKLYYVMRLVANAQKNYDKKTVDIMTNLAKELMRNGALSDPTRGEINRLLSAIKNATGKADLTAAATTLMDVMVSNQLRHAKNTLAQMLSIKAKKVNASGVEVQGTLDLVGQKLIATVKESVGLTLEKIDERIADAKEKMDSEFDTIKNNAAIDLVGLNIARKYVDGVVTSEAEEKDLRKELENAQEDKKAGKMTAEGLREFRKATEDAIRQNRMERTSAYRNILSEMAKLITESVTKAGQFRDAEKERIEKIHHYANSDMQGMDDAEHVNNDQRFTNNPILRFFLEPLSTMDQMLRQIGSKHVNGEGYLWNHYMRGWLEATEKEYLGVSAAHKALDAKANEVFGVKRWSDIFSIVRSLPSMHVEFWDGSKMRDHVLTQGNLLYIYMVNKMSDGKMKLRRMGIEEGQVRQMAMFMDPRLIEVGEWLQNEFLPSLRDKYNAVHEKMFGAPMAAIDSYFPIRVQANARTREVDVATPEAEAKASTITGAIIKRTKNSLALDVLGSDALDVVLGHIQEMEHWAAFAEWNRDLNTLLSYKKFRNKVQNMSGLYGSGATAWNNFRKACEVAAGVYKPASSVSAIDKTALNLAKGVTAGKISFRVFTAIKQLLSMPAFVSDANMMELSKSIATPWESWNWAMKELPLFQKRWLSRQAGDSRLMATESDWKLWKNSIVEAASRYGMAPNAFVDALTVSIGAKAIYETKLAKYIENGYSVDAAEKKAKQDATILFNESQQSNEGAFLSSIQVDRTWVSAALTVFRNSSMGYQRMLVDALRNIKHRMSKGYKDESIEFMAKQMVRDGLSESQAQRAAERMYNRGFWHNMMRVGTFGFLVQFAWYLGAYLPYLVLGADDDEKEKMLKDAATHALLGGFVEGLSGGSLISEASNLVASGKGLKDYDPSLMPIVSDMKRLVQLWSTDVVAAANETLNLIVQMAIGVNPQTLTDIGVAIYDACDGDPQTAREATLLLARILQVPQSQTEQIYIDEIDFTVDKALDLTIEEFAQRYATYKRLRNTPLTGWMYSDEEERKVEDRYIKRFTKRAEELKRTRGNEEAKAWYNYVDNEYKEVDKTIRELRSGAEKAAKREDRVSVEEFAARLQELMQTPEFERYQQRVGKVKAVEKLRQAMKDYPTKRDMLEDRMLEIRKQLVEEMQQAE